MNIGLVSTWFERGAAYVTKMYKEALDEKNNVLIYARGGEHFARDDKNWNQDYVTWGLNLRGTSINERHFKKWITKNKLDVIFFNEQRDFSIVAKMKKEFPHIKFGSYIDYYTEPMIKLYEIYDFIICNTKRHYEAFKQNKQEKYYVRWGTNIQTYNDENKKQNEQVTFFHSMGMSNRKGTDLLINAFINGKLYEQSKLIIHTQKSIDKTFNIETENLRDYNIEIINKTVTAPGLYHLGDVYVYPTKLDGLGLTLYEALAAGMPVITTDFPPMNEVIDNDLIGKRVKVKQLHSRSDGYYWPLSICDENSLIESMKFYIDHFENMKEYSQEARKTAIEKFNFKDRYEQINEIFTNAKAKNFNKEIYNQIISTEKKEKRKQLMNAISTKSYIENLIRNLLKNK